MPSNYGTDLKNAILRGCIKKLFNRDDVFFMKIIIRHDKRNQTQFCLRDSAQEHSRYGSCNENTADINLSSSDAHNSHQLEARFMINRSSES